MTTPGSVEFDKDMFVDILSHFFKVLADQDLDRLSIPILRDFLREQVLLEFTIQVGLHESTDIVLIQSSGFGLVLGHVLGQLDDSHTGQFVFLDTEKFQNSFVVFFVSVDRNKQELAFKVLGNLGSSGMVSSILIRAFAQEHQQVALDFTGEDFLSSFMVEINHQRKSICSHEFTDSFSVSQTFSEIITAFIEFLEKDNGFGFDFVLSGNFGSGGGNTEFVVIIRAGDFFEGLGGIGIQVSEKAYNGNFVILNEGFGDINGIQSDGRWSGLLFNPSNDSVSGTPSVVLNGLSVPEEFQSRVASDFKLFSQFGFFSSIDLGQLDGRFLLGQNTGGLSIFGSQRFAVSAPGSVELNQDEFVIGDSAFEILFSQNQNSFLFGDLVGHGQGNHTH